MRLTRTGHGSIPLQRKIVHMTIRRIVTTRVDGPFNGWDPLPIHLKDGSVWKLDESPQGSKYNKEASEHKPPFKGEWYDRDAAILRGKDRFFLKIDGKGKRRQVVPVHLPDPDRY